MGVPQWSKRKTLTQLSFTSHKIYLWVSTYHGSLSRSGIPPLRMILFLVPSICLGVKWQFLRKLGINLPKDTAIFPKDAQPYYKDICSTMFIEVLFVIDRTSKQPRCPSTGEWINKMYYIHTIEYQSTYFTL